MTTKLKTGEVQPQKQDVQTPTQDQSKYMKINISSKVTHIK